MFRMPFPFGLERNLTKVRAVPQLLCFTTGFCSCSKENKLLTDGMSLIWNLT